MSISKIFTLLGVAIVLTALGGCGLGNLRDQNFDIDPRGWQQDSLVVFNFEIPDSTAAYNFYYTIRYNANYPYYNLFVSYNMLDSTEALISGQLQDLNLFNPKTGEPLGSGLGSVYSRKFLALENYRFVNTGQYTFTLKHYMRTDTLQGVVSVGVSLAKTEPMVKKTIE